MLRTCLILLTCTAATFAQGEPPSVLTDGHAALKHEEGVWDVTCQFWMAPGAAPVKGTAVETNKLIGGGLWLLSTFDMSDGPFPFVGHAQMGYDAKTKKYVGTWVDSMTPTQTTMSGEWDAEKKQMTFLNKGIDAQTGKPTLMKSVMTATGEGKKHAVFHMVDKNGKELFKMMEFDYVLREGDE